MSALLCKLWSDDTGAVVSSELILVIALVVIGVIPGLVSLRNGENASLGDIANALLAVNLNFSFSGFAIGTQHFSPTFLVIHNNFAQVGGVSFSGTNSTFFASAEGNANFNVAVPPVNPAP
ncbi:MAG TPA: hypothetical protein VMS17_33380 [Gemmataceae bacterium]|nr:hypothetical protein [Gemmataceae bacterium]